MGLGSYGLKAAIIAKSLQTLPSSQSLTSCGIQPGREETRAAGWTTETEPEKQLRLNTEKGFERQTEVSLHWEIAERWNAYNCQRMAAVLSLELHSEGSWRAQKFESGGKRGDINEEKQNQTIQSCIFPTAVFSFRRKEELFWRMTFHVVPCGSAIISECASKAQSTLRKVMYVMKWNFLQFSFQPINTGNQI